MRFWRLWIGVIFILIAVALVAPVVTTLLTPPEPQVIDEQRGNAHVYFTAEPGRVWGYESCQQVTWRLSGIQAVKLNDVGVVGEGTQAICGTSPYLAVTFQDGASQYYWLKRDIVLTAEARLAVIAAALLLCSVPFVLSARLSARLAQAKPLQSGKRKLQNEPRSALWFLLAITLVGFALRVSLIDMPVRADESRTFIKYAAQPLDTLLVVYDEPGNHIFHTLLVHIVYKLFGHGNWVIRLPAFVAGMLLIPVTYIVGKALHSRAAGLAAAAFVAASSGLIAYSVNARGYTLVCLFFLLLVLLGHRLLQHPRWRGWLLFAVIAALGFYTIPVMLYPYAACMLWLLLRVGFSSQGVARRRLLVQLIASGGVTFILALLLYLPVILNAGLVALVGNPWVSALPATEFWQEYARVPETLFAFMTRELPFAAKLVFLATIGIGLIPIRHRRNQPALVLVFTLGVLLGFGIIQRVVVFERLMLYTIPVFAVVGAVGVVRVGEFVGRGATGHTWALGAVSVVYALVAGLLAATDARVVDHDLVDFEPIAGYLEPLLKPTDGVASITWTQNLGYYFFQHEYPSDALAYSTEEVKRVYLVVRYDQTPEEVLVFNGMDSDHFGPGRLVRADTHFDLYVAERLEES